MVQSLPDACAQPINNRRCDFGRKLGLRFLLDKGANVSVFPVCKCRSNINNNVSYNFFAANGAGIKTLSLDTQMRRPYWTCIIVKVNQPFLGADFFNTKTL